MARVSGEVAERLLQSDVRVGDVLRPSSTKTGYLVAPRSCRFLVIGVWMTIADNWKETRITTIEITGRIVGQESWSQSWILSHMELVEIGRNDLFIAAPEISPRGYFHAIVKIKGEPFYTAGCRRFDSWAAGSKHWSAKRHHGERGWERETNTALWKQARKLGWVAPRQVKAKGR